MRPSGAVAPCVAAAAAGTDCCFAEVTGPGCRIPGRLCSSSSASAGGDCRAALGRRASRSRSVRTIRAPCQPLPCSRGRNRRVQHIASHSCAAVPSMRPGPATASARTSARHASGTAAPAGSVRVNAQSRRGTPFPRHSGRTPHAIRSLMRPSLTNAQKVWSPRGPRTSRPSPPEAASLPGSTSWRHPTIDHGEAMNPPSVVAGPWVMLLRR